jgi:hypothetical protein
MERIRTKDRTDWLPSYSSMHSDWWSSMSEWEANIYPETNLIAANPMNGHRWLQWKSTKIYYLLYFGRLLRFIAGIAEQIMHLNLSASDNLLCSCEHSALMWLGAHFLFAVVVSLLCDQTTMLLFLYLISKRPITHNVNNGHHLEDPLPNFSERYKRDFRFLFFTECCPCACIFSEQCSY